MLENAGSNGGQIQPHLSTLMAPKGGKECPNRNFFLKVCIKIAFSVYVWYQTCKIIIMKPWVKFDPIFSTLRAKNTMKEASNRKMILRQRCLKSLFLSIYCLKNAKIEKQFLRQFASFCVMGRSAGSQESL